MVTQKEVDQINKVLRGEISADKAKQNVIKIASDNQRKSRSSGSSSKSSSNVLASQASTPEPVVAPEPYQPSGWSNVKDTFELIGRKIGNVFVPGQPYTDNRDLPTSASQKWTDFLTSPGFVFGAPAAVAGGVALFGAGSTAAAAAPAALPVAAAPAAAAGVSSSLFGGWKSAGLLLGAGALASSLLFGSGGSAKTAPQDVLQTPSVNVTPTTNPAQTTTVNPNQGGDIFQGGAPYQTGPGTFTYAPVSNVANNQYTTNNSTQNTTSNVLTTTTTTSNQAQSAGTGIDPIVLAIGAGALLLLSRD